MKPFQFYLVDEFPRLSAGEDVSTQYQTTLFGEDEPVSTVLTLERSDFEGPLDQIRVVSQVKHKAFGYIKRIINDERRKIDFNEYLEPVDFYAYHANRAKVMILQAPKTQCRGVFVNISRGNCGVKLREMRVDFVKVNDICTEYLGAWFRGVSARVTAAGMHGQQIQNDNLFKKLNREAELSNVTIPWRMGDIEHRVMITSSAGVVIVQDYNINIGLELQIVWDVFNRLLSKVWYEKPIKGRLDI